jgi:hypothetical protein
MSYLIEINVDLNCAVNSVRSANFYDFRCTANPFIICYEEQELAAMAGVMVVV